MLAKMIDKITELAKPQIFEIDGQTCTDGNLKRVPPHVDRPEEIKVTSLDAVEKLVREEWDLMGDVLFVHIAGYKTVRVFTALEADYSRNALYKAEADVPDFRTGWRDRETALIELRSLFIPNQGTEYLLSLLKSTSAESTVATTDNGVTQTVEARQGIALSKMMEVQPRVSLQPFRTFLEVDQPESDFLLRLDEDGKIGLFEADGGVWKLEAKQNVADNLEKRLDDMITAGKVVVMK